MNKKIFDKRLCFEGIKSLKLVGMVFLVLGIIGLIGFGILISNMGKIYMPVFERISVYTLVIWNFITGVYLIKDNN